MTGAGSTPPTRRTSSTATSIATATCGPGITTASATRTWKPTASAAPSPGICARTCSSCRSPDYQSVKRDYVEDSDASPFADFNFFQVTDAEQLSQEFRLRGDEGDFRWLTGFFYLHVNVQDANGAETPLTTTFTNPIFGLGGPLIDGPGGAFGTLAEGDGTFLGNDNPYRTITNSWSLFGQVEYDFSPQWTGIAGFRWIEEHKKHRFHNNFVDFQPGTRWRNGNPNIIANLGTYKGDLDAGMWSAKAGSISNPPTTSCST